MNKLFYNTVTPQLLYILKHLMEVKEFINFRLVGGTALSLYLGHRISVDIDLFTDAPYGSIDFGAIDTFLSKHYSYVDSIKSQHIGMGKSYFIGENKENCIKLDLFYTDDFIHEALIIDGLRLATVEEVIAMKLEVISNGGRKKDFWDIHELREAFSINEMIVWHKKRYPYGHDTQSLVANFTNFKKADEDFDPICLHHKYWEIIKLDLVDDMKSYQID